MQNQKTPTEIAFEKARYYDAIVGYYAEQRGVCQTGEDMASGELIVRYQIPMVDWVSNILGYLEKTFKNGQSS